MFSDLSRTLQTLESIQRAFDRAMNPDFFGNATSWRGVEPAVNVFRAAPDAYAVKAEIPGVRKEDVQIEVRGELLRITAERKPDAPFEGMSVHRAERAFPRIDRTIKLPFLIEADKTKAELKDGILTVTLQQAEKDRPRRIDIH